MTHRPASHAPCVPQPPPPPKAFGSAPAYTQALYIVCDLLTVYDAYTHIVNTATNPLAALGGGSGLFSNLGLASTTSGPLVGLVT